MRKTLLALAAASALAACGKQSTVADAAGGPTLDMASSPLADLATAPTGDLAGTGSASYSLAPFSLAPGEEKINCYYVPPVGRDRYVNRITVEMNAGSHHLVVFRIKDPQGMPASGPMPCSQVDIPSGLNGMLPGSQQQHSDMTLPDGVALLIAHDEGLYFQSHYINATPKDTITTKVTYTFTTVDPSTVMQTAGMIFYSNFGLDIPPGMSTAPKTCLAPQDLNLVTATGHMHKHGLTFDATVAGQSVYHTDNWDEPNGAVFPAPGRAVKSGDPITWTCAYNNDTGMPLKFGNSAVTNEMCIFAGIYYPAKDSQTLFFCQK